jgi:hypothetical protein
VAQIGFLGSYRVLVLVSFPVHMNAGMGFVWLTLLASGAIPEKWD